MSGLFRRARAVRTRLELLGDLQGGNFTLDIPMDERDRVLSGIDSMLKDERIRIDEGAGNFIPRKRSFVLPLALNLGAIVILGIGALVMWNSFGKSQSVLSKSETGLESAEGRILQRLRQDAEAELGEKDREIAGIRGLLENLENQKSLLVMETESRLSEREAELRREFESELAAERERLAATGVTGDNLSAAMASYEAEVQGRLDSELAAARASAAAEQERRLTELEDQRALYEGQIAAADARRLELQADLEARNTELARMEEQTVRDASEASRQLEELRARQQREGNVTDQILSFYGRVGAARAAGDTETASKTLDALELYLREDGIRTMAVVENRREIDSFLTGALRRLIALESGAAVSEAAPVPVPVPEDNRSAEILASLTAGAAAGNQLAGAGNIQAARNAWRDAFSAIPELERAFDTAMESASAEAALAGGAAVLTAADLALARDQGLAEGYSRGRAETLDASAAQAESLREEGYQEGRRIALAESSGETERLRTLLSNLTGRIAAMQEQYRGVLVRNEAEIQGSRDRLVDLLDRKLEIKAALDPALHPSLDEYTNAAGDQRELEGREAVYAEILSFLSELQVSADE